MGRNRWGPHVIPLYKAAIKILIVLVRSFLKAVTSTANRDKSVLIIAGTDLTLAFVERIYNSVS